MEIIRIASPLPATQPELIPFDKTLDLIAGETVQPSDSCYISAADGRAYRCLGAEGAATDRCHGQAMNGSAAGSTLRLATGLSWFFGTALTPGAEYYASATVPGGLTDVAPYAGARSIAYAVDATRVQFYMPAANNPNGGSGIIADADAATITFDISIGLKHSVTLGGNRILAFANGLIGNEITLVLKQDATGSRTVTWPAGVLWPGGAAPTLTATAGKRDSFGFLQTGSAEWIGRVLAENF